MVERVKLPSPVLTSNFSVIYNLFFQPTGKIYRECPDAPGAKDVCFSPPLLQSFTHPPHKSENPGPDPDYLTIRIVITDPFRPTCLLRLLLNCKLK